MIPIFIGSENDRPFLTEGLAFLKEHGIPYTVFVASVHRGPIQATADILTVLEDTTLRIIIGGAASATGLPGILAGIIQERGLKILPIGVRFEKNPGARILEDASFALSSMPRGVPLLYAGVNNTGFLHACMIANRVSC